MLLELRDICKTYVTDEMETRALADVSISIDRGEYVSIEGPSGCGKSTLLSVLGLLETPTGGSYAIAGKPVEDLSIHERAAIRNREIGFIFQNFNLIGDLTAEENVELPLAYRGVTKGERRRRVREVLDLVDMAHRGRHYPSQLSGGQQQRVAVARALAGNPSVLLADEPTGNLDSAHGESIMELLTQLYIGGATIVMVTHDRRFAGYAQRTIGLLDGRLVATAELVEARL